MTTAFAMTCQPRYETLGVKAQTRESQVPTFTPLIDPYIMFRRSQGDFGRSSTYTARRACGSFGEHVGARPLANLSPVHVEAWQAKLVKAGYAPTTRRLYLSAVRQLFVWAIRRGHCRRNPAAEVKGPREPRRLPRALNHDQVAAVLAQCVDARDRLIVLLMVQLGLRCIEVHRLEVGDIDLTNRLLRVTGKGGHERVLPIVPELHEALLSYLAEHPTHAGPLVRNYTDCQRALHPAVLSRKVTQLMWDAGIKRARGDGVSAHAFRHTCLTDVLRGGSHLRDVQAAAGHKHLATTERYLPLIVNGLEEAMAGRTYGGSPSREG